MRAGVRGGGLVTTAAGSKPKPFFARSKPHDRRFPFQVRRVDKVAKRYVLVEGEIYQYADACIVADAAVDASGEHHVVWDTLNERVLYDSRRVIR